MSLGKWIFDKIYNYLTKSTGDDTNSFLCDFDRICHEIIPGDILLIEGRNRISNIIKNIVRSPWTHQAKERLLKLTPANYTGLASALAKRIGDK